MKKPDLTLNDVKKSPKLTGKVYQASDFLTNEEKAEIRAKRFNRPKAEKRKYDDIDAMCAEIVARFGYDVYKAWNAGKIATEKIVKWCYAERARDKRRLLNLESLVLQNAMAQTAKKPKDALKVAMKVIKSDERQAKGEF